MGRAEAQFSRHGAVRCGRATARIPVSSLVLLGMDVRFGAPALPVEGYAGVSMPPEHRRRGYMDRLFRRSLGGAARRVSVACLYGIADFYPRFGFVTCQRDIEWSVSLYNTQRLAPVPDGALRAVAPSTCRRCARCSIACTVSGRGR